MVWGEGSEQFDLKESLTIHHDHTGLSDLLQHQLRFNEILFPDNGAVDHDQPQFGSWGIYMTAEVHFRN